MARYPDKEAIVPTTDNSGHSSNGGQDGRLPRATVDRAGPIGDDWVGDGDLSNGHLRAYYADSAMHIWYNKKDGPTAEIQLGIQVDGQTELLTDFMSVNVGEYAQYSWEYHINMHEHCVRGFMVTKGGDFFKTKEFGGRC